MHEKNTPGFSLKAIFRISMSCSLFSVFLLSNAQSNSGIQTWSDLNYSFVSSIKHSYRASTGVRGLISSPDYLLLYFEPGIKYSLNSTFQIEADAGVYLNFHSSTPNYTEIRTGQALTLSWPRLKRITFKNRFKVEERYFHYYSTSVGEDVAYDDWEFRGRYRLSGRSEYFDVGERMRNLYLLSAIEFYIPLGADAVEKFSDKSRIYVGLGQILPREWHYELHFMWQQSRNEFTGDFQVDQLVIRFRIYFRTVRSNEVLPE